MTASHTFTEDAPTWAVHSWYSPAIEIDGAGTYTHDGVARILAGSPLHVADTREEAEAWRFAQPSDIPAHSRWNALSGDVG